MFVQRSMIVTYVRNLLRALSSQCFEGLWLLHRFYVFVVVGSRSEEPQVSIRSVQATGSTSSKEKRMKRSLPLSPQMATASSSARRSGRRCCSLLFCSHRFGYRRSSILFRSPGKGRRPMDGESAAAWSLHGGGGKVGAASLRRSSAARQVSSSASRHHVPTRIPAGWIATARTCTQQGLAGPMLEED
jgi:hypothetical protein